MRRLLVPLLAALLVATAVLAVPTSAGAAKLPPKATWERQNARIMAGSVGVLRQRVEDAEEGERLAINLDIDNTSLASHYAPGRPIAPTLRLARAAREMGVAVLFNTGRREDRLPAAVAQLRAAGFPVDGICGRPSGTRIVVGKQACRRQYVAEGYTLAVNVGNLRTDFVGGNYERRYKLRSYGGRLK